MSEAVTRSWPVDPDWNSLPFLAQMRSVDRVRKCLLFGVDRTYCGRYETDANDPKRTWRHLLRADRRPGRSELFDHTAAAPPDQTTKVLPFIAASSRRHRGR